MPTWRMCLHSSLNETIGISCSRTSALRTTGTLAQGLAFPLKVSPRFGHRVECDEGLYLLVTIPIADIVDRRASNCLAVVHVRHFTRPTTWGAICRPTDARGEIVDGSKKTTEKPINRGEYGKENLWHEIDDTRFEKIQKPAKILLLPKLYESKLE